MKDGIKDKDVAAIDKENALSQRNVLSRLFHISLNTMIRKQNEILTAENMNSEHLQISKMLQKPATKIAFRKKKH